MKPAYEIVPGIDLQPGDLIRTRPTSDPDGEVGEHVADVYRLRPDLMVFRQLPLERNPEVLMRALEIQQREMIDACIGNPVERTIEQAIRELEDAKGGDGETSV